jgi:hypothetical protein
MIKVVKFNLAGRYSQYRSAFYHADMLLGDGLVNYVISIGVKF